MKRKIIPALLLCLCLLAASCAGGNPKTDGRIEGNTYENPALKLAFTAPEGWRLCDRDGIADLVGVKPSDPTIADYEFVAIENDGISSVELSLIPCDDLAGARQRYVDDLKKASETPQGLKYTFSEERPVRLGVTDFVCLPAMVSIANIDTQRYYYFAGLEDSGLLAVIIVTAGPELSTELAEAMFSKK